LLLAERDCTGEDLSARGRKKGREKKKKKLLDGNKEGKGLADAQSMVEETDVRGVSFPTTEIEGAYVVDNPRFPGVRRGGRNVGRAHDKSVVQSCDSGSGGRGV